VDVQARALATLKEMVETPVCKLNLNQYPPLFVENPPSGPPQTPFSLNSKTKGDVRAPAKSLDASVSYQTYGFGLGGVSLFPLDSSQANGISPDCQLC
jgi:hypothetical protein